MKNKEPLILTELLADRVRLRAVLRDWGYGENAIHRVLTEHRIVQSRYDHYPRSRVPEAICWYSLVVVRSRLRKFFHFRHSTVRQNMRTKFPMLPVAHGPISPG